MPPKPIPFVPQTTTEAVPPLMDLRAHDDVLMHLCLTQKNAGEIITRRRLV